MASKTIKRSFTLLVTANAPTHLQRSSLLEDFHLLNFAVAFLARDTRATLIFALDVPLVWEPNKIRKVMDLHPLNGLIFIVGFSDLFDIFAIGPDDLVAAHTCVA
jgi:hypothetical protein